MHFVYFDVETERAAEEVGGWNNIEQFGLAIAVTLSSRDGQFRVYRKNEVSPLVDELRACDCVVGFNTRRFDFRVVQPYIDFNLQTLTNIDMLLDLTAVLGFRVTLDNCCAATFGECKSGSGLQSVAWWKEGRHDEVIEYCKQDVLLTRRLHEFGATHGHIKCLDRRGRPRTIAVPWKLEGNPSVPLQGSLF